MLRMPRKRPQVLGADLKCSESSLVIRPGNDASYTTGGEPVRRQLVVPDHVLDVLVAEPCLQRPRIVPGILKSAFAIPARTPMMVLLRSPSQRVASLGRRTVNTEPLPGSLATVTSPP